MKRSSPYFVLEENDHYVSLRQQMRDYESRLVDKWAWLLEGAAEPSSKDRQLAKIDERLYTPLAMMFENQYALSLELREDELTTDVTLPTVYSLPLIRKLFPNLIATRICSIQPMPLISGGVANAYFQDFIRESTSVSTTTADSDYALGSEQSVPKKIKMQITSTSVTAIKDILGAVWSSEIATDARGTLGIDVESEHLNELAAEILREIDERILMEILNGASAGNTNWDVNVDEGYTAKEWYETLGHAFIDADSDLYDKRYRDADYIVAGRDLYDSLRKMSSFDYTRSRDANEPSMRLATKKMGTINESIDVYRSTVITSTKGIVGYYPTSAIDGGYIWMPYEMLSTMPLVYATYDSTTGVYANKDSWTRNVRTRYGKYLVSGDAYATITQTDES